MGSPGMRWMGLHGAKRTEREGAPEPRNADGRVRVFRCQGPWRESLSVRWVAMLRRVSAVASMQGIEGASQGSIGLCPGRMDGWGQATSDGCGRPRSVPTDQIMKSVKSLMDDTSDTSAMGYSHRAQKVTAVLRPNSYVNHPEVPDGRDDSWLVPCVCFSTASKVPSHG